MTGDRDVAGMAWALYRMSRPSQLLLIAVVYALGIAVAVVRAGTKVGPAASGFDWMGVAGGLCALVPLAASVHYANEYADYETDALTTRTPFSGGSGVLPRTGISRVVALRAARVAFVVGVVATAAHLVAGLLGVVATLVLAAIVVFGWHYSVGVALAWRGLGELDNAALGGLALPLYGFAVQAGTVTLGALLACVPFFALVFCNLLETTWPDRDADGTVGKDTLATRWPRHSLRRLYFAGAAVALLSPIALWGWVLPTPVVAACLSVTPLVAWGAHRYTRRRLPFPSVAAMVVSAVAQLAAWAWIAGVGLQ